MFHVEDGLRAPGHVIPNVGYLLEDPVEGVAYDPPNSARSTSISSEHAGHVT